MNTPIHFVVPAYGASPYLSETLESLVNATDSSVPITVIDDATPSTHVWDATKKFYGRITYERNDINLGVAANFARALEISTGEFTVIVGSDDRVLPNYIAEFRRCLELNPYATVVHPQVRIIDAFGRPILPIQDRVKSIINKRLARNRSLAGVPLLNRLLLGDWLYFPAIAWRTTEVKQHQWNEQLKTACDLDFLLRLIFSGAEFVFGSVPSFEYRRHAFSISSALAASGFRLIEELTVHTSFLRQNWRDLPRSSRLLCRLALTIRLHGLWMACTSLTRNPKLCWRLILASLRPMTIGRNSK